MKHNLSILSICSVVLILAIAGPSYIHPDELFQSQEVLLAAGGERHSNTPWEFSDADRPSRSVVPPAVFVGGPLAVGHWIAKNTAASSVFGWAPSLSIRAIESIIFCRILVAGLAILGVSACSRVAAAHGISPTATVAFLLSSWVGCVMLGRPFSNSSEALMLVLLLALVVRLRRRLASGGSCLSFACAGAMLGGAAAFGLFVRFTFAAFALPTVALCAAEAAWLAFCQKADRVTQEASARLPSCVPFTRRKFLLLALSAILGLISCVVMVVAVDSVFFGGFNSFTHMADTAAAALQGDAAAAAKLRAGLRVAPWNNFLYNLDHANLAQHGIHPRFQHALVNGHIMFGPAWPLAWAFVVVAFVSALCGAVRPSSDPGSEKVLSSGGDAQELALTHGFRPWHLLLWSACTLVCGTLALSTAPHQEPRFLAPLLWPIAFIVAHCVSNSRTPSHSAAGPSTSWSAFSNNSARRMFARPALRIGFWVAWCAFNVVVGTLFGFRHQAGLVDAAVSLGADARQASLRLLARAQASALHGKVDSALSSAASQPLITELTVHAAFAGTYMVPHTALQLESAALIAQRASSEGWRGHCRHFDSSRNELIGRFDWTAVLRPAPWALQGAGGASSEEIRREGAFFCFRVRMHGQSESRFVTDDPCGATGLLHIRAVNACFNATHALSPVGDDSTSSPTTGALPINTAVASSEEGLARLRLHLHEFGDADTTGLRLFVEACSGSLRHAQTSTHRASALDITPSSLTAREGVCLLYTPVSVWSKLADAVAQVSDKRCTASLGGVLPRYLSMESPPTGISGWLAALLPDAIASPTAALLGLSSPEDGGLGLAVAQVSCQPE